MARNITDEVEAKIVQWEGEVLHAYDDFDPQHRFIKPGMTVRGTLTIGVGHTGSDVKPGMRISVEESRKFLRADIDRFEAAVEKHVKVPLSDNQFGALVSFCMNVGEGNFARSTLLKKLNKSDYEAVPAELMKWINSKGKRMQGLVNRRAQESALWGKGDFVASAVVDAEPKKKPLLDKETVTWGAGIGTTIIGGFSGAFASTGPVSIALAVILVGLFGLGAYWLIKNRVLAK